MALSDISSKIKQDIGRKSPFLHTLPTFDALVREDPRRNIAITFGVKKLQWWGYQGEKVWWYVYSFQHSTRMWQTAERTDGQTPYDGIGCAMQPSCTRAAKTGWTYNCNLQWQIPRFTLWQCNINLLIATLNRRLTDHNIALQWLVHWPLMGGLLHLVQEGTGRAAARPVPSSPPINGQCTNFVLFDVAQ